MLYELALFAGGGGGILGGKLLGWETVCAVEIEEYAREILKARQDDGILAPFPIWDDIRSFTADNPECAGVFDHLRQLRDSLVISGGFPCKDISAAGSGDGIEGKHSSLWGEMARIIGEIRPRRVFVENSWLLVRRGLGRVLSDLAEMGYDAKWGCLGAHHSGAPHFRDRLWLVAAHSDCGSSLPHRPDPGDGGTLSVEGQLRSLLGSIGSEVLADSGGGGFPRSEEELRAGRHAPDRSGSILADSQQQGLEGLRGDAGEPEESESGDRGAPVCHPDGKRRDGRPGDGRVLQREGESEDAVWWGTEPRVGGVAHGLAAGMDGYLPFDAEGNLARLAPGISSRKQRLIALGNGQVPACVPLAWELLS